MAFLGLPTILVFAYGIFSDSVRLFNSTKKSYILMLSLLQIASCLLLCFTDVTVTDVKLVSFYLLLNSFAMAWTDVLVDGLMVTQ